MTCAWSGTIKELKTFIQTGKFISSISSGFESRFAIPTDSEILSWKNSIPQLINVLNDEKFDDIQILIEFAMPIGLARADVIKAQGLSEAEAMAKKAESWKQYNEAAITQMFIEVLPELAKNIAEPLSKTDKIVVVNSGGNGTGAGASKITGDVTNIIAQLPPVVEALSGVDLGDMLKRIPALGGGSKQTKKPTS